MNEQKTLHYALIGSGMMGQEHIKNLQLFDHAKIIGIYEPDQAMQNASIKLQKELKIYNSIAELIAEDKLDAIIIASPNFVHCEQLLELSRCKKIPILVEKPLCISLDQIALLSDFARKYQAPVWVAMEYRYMPAIASLIKLVKEKRIGNLISLAIREHRYPFLEKVQNWNRFNHFTGGTLVEKCCHFFDLMCHIIQSEPVRIFASGAQDVNHLDEFYDNQQSDILDNAFVIVDFKNKKRASLDLCMFAEGAHFQEEICAIGDEGTIECKVPGPTRFWSDHRGKQPLAEVSVNFRNQRKPRLERIPVDQKLLDVGDHNGATFYQHRQFQKVISDQQPVEVSIENGLRAVLMGLAAQESIKTGQSISLEKGQFKLELNSN